LKQTKKKEKGKLKEKKKKNGFFIKTVTQPLAVTSPHAKWGVQYWGKMEKTRKKLNLWAVFFSLFLILMLVKYKNKPIIFDFFF